MNISKTLKQSYKRYRKRGASKRRALSFLRAFMPEIVFRTTRLEGETVTRRMVKSIFG